MPPRSSGINYPTPAPASLVPTPAPTPAPVPASVIQISPADDLVIDVTTNEGHFSVTLNPREVSRLRTRYGKGTEFEKWLTMRVRDMLNNFGGM